MAFIKDNIKKVFITANGTPIEFNSTLKNKNLSLTYKTATNLITSLLLLQGLKCKKSCIGLSHSSLEIFTASPISYSFEF